MNQIERMKVLIKLKEWKSWNNPGMSSSLKGGNPDYLICDYLNEEIKYLFSATKALKDAAISYTDVEQVVCGYVYGMVTFIHFQIFHRCRVER